jgi:hypothetical protein
LTWTYVRQIKVVGVMELRLASTLPLDPAMKICVPLFVETIRRIAPVTVTS